MDPSAFTFFILDPWSPSFPPFPRSLPSIPACLTPWRAWTYSTRRQAIGWDGMVGEQEKEGEVYMLSYEDSLRCWDCLEGSPFGRGFPGPQRPKGKPKQSPAKAKNPSMKGVPERWSLFHVFTGLCLGSPLQCPYLPLLPSISALLSLQPFNVWRGEGRE